MSREIALDMALTYWTEIVAAEVGGLPQTRGRARRLLAERLAEHGWDAVIDVLAWYRTDHALAVWLRTQRLGLLTLMRPTKFDRYLQLARGGEL